MRPSLKPLKQQVIVITGASSGIGLATARLAARRGAKLVLASRSESTLDDVVDEINRSGGEATYVACDVGEREEVQRVAEEALSRFGRIDTWVNNAGVSIYGKLEEVSEEDMRKLFDTNFWGVVNGSLVALPYLKQRGGALINLGSEVSEAVVPLQGIYSASKHAVKGFTDALRVEVEENEKAPVSITLIQPTATDTPFPHNAKNYLSREPKLPSPLDNPEDVAEAILDAAVHPTRSKKVGAMSKIGTTIAKVAPSLGDKLAAKQAGRQQYDEAPRDRAGTLFKAGETGRVRGTTAPAELFRERSRRSSGGFFGFGGREERRPAERERHDGSGVMGAVTLFALGAGAVYLLDPRRGAERRQALLDTLSSGASQWSRGGTSSERTLREDSQTSSRL